MSQFLDDPGMKPSPEIIITSFHDFPLIKKAVILLPTYPH